LTVLAIAAALAGCSASAPSGQSAGFVPAAAPRVPHAAAAIEILPGKPGAVESSLVLGANMANWYDVTQSGLAAAFRSAGMAATRWPGGSESDIFHWQTNSLGAAPCNGSYVNPNSSFDNFVTQVARPAHLDVAVTVNYGSNPSCNAGASPAEAAAWVAYANTTKHYGVTWWTVGNEEFGSWEEDLHSQPHSGTQYAANVAGSGGFYALMKAASATPIKVGDDVEPRYNSGATAVRSGAP